MGQGDHETAAVYYRKWVEADPNDAAALYNLACCEARLQRSVEALDVLRQAGAAGWSDSANSAEDPDLATLREQHDFQKLLSEFAANARSRYDGFLHHACLQQRMGDYLVVLPVNFDPTLRYPLVILLHGHGSSPEKFAHVAATIDTCNFIFAVPRGAYMARYTDGSGYSHERERDNAADSLRGLVQAADWVVTVADDVAGRYPIVDSTFWVVGFSQGAALAHTVAAYHPSRVAGYCAHSGYFVERAVSPEHLAAEKAAGIRVLLTHGRQDPVIPLADGIDAFNRLQKAGVDVTMIQMDVLHRFPAEVGVVVGKWLREQIKNKRSTSGH